MEGEEEVRHASSKSIVVASFFKCPAAVNHRYHSVC